MVALVAARCGAEDVLATDGDEGVCDVLRENVGRNGLGGRVRVEQRQWGGKRDVPEDVQLVVGADVVGSSHPGVLEGEGEGGGGMREG